MLTNNWFRRGSSAVPKKGKKIKLKLLKVGIDKISIIHGKLNRVFPYS